MPIKPKHTRKADDRKEMYKLVGIVLFAADEGHQQQGRPEDQGRDHDGGLGTSERPIQLNCVLFLHPFEGAIRFLVHALLEPLGSEHGDQRQDECADQSEGHGLGHGMEQFARGPGQRINRQIPGEDQQKLRLRGSRPVTYGERHYTWHHEYWHKRHISKAHISARAFRDAYHTYNLSMIHLDLPPIAHQRKLSA